MHKSQSTYMVAVKPLYFYVVCYTEKATHTHNSTIYLMVGIVELCYATCLKWRIVHTAILTVEVDI